jgi:C4-type Zn-finger protein
MNLRNNVKHFSIKCPECDTAETLKVEMNPMFYIQTTVDIEVSNMKCDNCGYDGEAYGKELTYNDKK